MNRDLNLKYEQMSQKALVGKCYDLEAELQRARGGLRESSDRVSSLRHQHSKMVRVQKKAKGKIDRLSKQFIKESAIRSVLGNVVSLGITIPASLQDGSFSVYLLLNGLCSAGLVPLQTYLQKRNEEH